MDAPDYEDIWNMSFFTSSDENSIRFSDEELSENTDVVPEIDIEECSVLFDQTPAPTKH